MTSNPRDPGDQPPSSASEGFSLPPSSTSGPRGASRGGSQGASRGGQRPDAPPDDERASWSGRGGRTTDPGRVSDWLPKGGSNTFLGLPLALIYVIGISMIGLVLLGAVCARPAANGSVAGQVKALSADRQVSTLAGAQVILRGSNDTYTAVSTSVPDDATGDAAYNYRFDSVPTGTYTMAVTPPPDSNLQPEDNITLKVESGQLFPQSVMLLANGIQKPRPLAPSELEPGQTGYINDRGERVVYQQGSGFNATDALLLYLLWRNPPSYGYGAPPVIVSNPGGYSTGTASTSGSYRVDPPPTTSRTGQTVTQRPPSVPGQGSTRPSSSTGATGSTGTGPAYNSDGSGSSSSGATTSSGSSSSGGSATNRSSSSSSSSPSQGVSRPSSSGSSSSSRPSVSSPSRSSGSGGGGRR
jgi:hypothetical protein